MVEESTGNHEITQSTEGQRIPQKFDRTTWPSIIPRLREQHLGEKTIDKFLNLDNTINEANQGEIGLVDHVRAQIDAGVSINSLCASLGIDKKAFKVFAQTVGITYPDRLTSNRNTMLRKWQEDEDFKTKSRAGQLKGAAANKTPELRQLHSKRTTDYFVQHPEAKEGMSQRSSAQWAQLEPEEAELRIKAMVERLNDPKVRAKQKLASSKSLTDQWKDETFRANNRALSSQRVLEGMTPGSDWLKNFRTAARQARLDPEKIGRYKIPTIHGERRDVGESQSIWEANIARMFTYLGVKFERRAQLSLSTGRIFSLDFLIYPEGEEDVPVFYEILANPIDSPEGWDRLEQAKKDYPNMEFLPITNNDYRRIETEFKDAIDSDSRFSGWETYQDNLKTNPGKYGAIPVGV